MADPVLNHDRMLTYEDYVNLPEDLNRYEILEGELVMTPAPSTRHQRISRNLGFLIHGHVRASGAGEVLHAPFDVVFHVSTIAQPDLVYFSKDRSDLISSRGAEGPPDLVVEILSPTTARRDRIKKFRIYAKFGVQWYWIIDPDNQTIEEYERTGDSFVRRGECEGDEVFKPLLFPDLEIDLADVWE
jgi:Uma2 family endonuclease